MTGEAVVDLGALAGNVRLLAARSRGALMAVVKADGFGHGMVPVARTALANGASWLGVTSVAEAMTVRGAGITAPVLAWLYGPDEDFSVPIRAKVDLSVSSLEHLQAIAGAAERCDEAAHVHLKVDTGLSRNGAPASQWPGLVMWARKFEAAGLVRVRGVWSHLACADEPDHPSVRLQVEGFRHYPVTVAHYQYDTTSTSSAAVKSAPASATGGWFPPPPTVPSQVWLS